MSKSKRIVATGTEPYTYWYYAISIFSTIATGLSKATAPPMRPAMTRECFKSSSKTDSRHDQPPAQRRKTMARAPAPSITTRRCYW